MQRYDWIHTFNVRDLGYTPTMNGKYIKPQRFIRSDAPHTIDDAVKEFLIEHNIIRTGYFVIRSADRPCVPSTTSFSIPPDRESMTVPT